MTPTERLIAYLNAHPGAIGKVVDFDEGIDRLYPFDFTAANTELDIEVLIDTDQFCKWIDARLADSGCRYGIGGYMEHRTLYARSPLFNSKHEPRRLHLGIDIWAAAGTPVYSPLNGTVHSFSDNNNFGDYGPTIILEYDLDGPKLYNLFGHLSRASLDGLRIGLPISKNQKIGELGTTDVNGNWPPHLHFQLMFDMEGKAGDYPGVGKFSEIEQWRQNVPDPNLILRFPVPQA